LHWRIRKTEINLVKWYSRTIGTSSLEASLLGSSVA